MTDTFVVDDKGRPTIDKDPNAVLDYEWDWTDWLDAIPDTIDTAEIIVPTGEEPTVTVDSHEVLSGNKKVVAWLSGGDVGTKVRVTCRIHTTSIPPRTDDRSVFLKVKER